MAVFTYVTQAYRGAPLTAGRIFGPNRFHVLEKLLERGVPVVALEQPGKPRLPVLARKRILLRQKLAFSEKLEAALYMRMPLDRALLASVGRTSLEVAASSFGESKPLLQREINWTSRSKRHLTAIVTEITRRVVAGKKLHEVAEDFPNLFDPVGVGLIQAGESSSTLDTNLRSWRESLQRSEKWVHDFKMMMVYPLIVLLIAAGVIGVVTNVVVPAYKSLYAEFHRQLPLSTRTLVAVSDFCTTYPYLVLPLAALIFLGLSYCPSLFQRNPKLHSLALKIPLVGGLNKLALQANFIRTFARLKKAGVSLDESLLLCQKVSWNYQYKAALARAVKFVRDGKSLGQAMAADTEIIGEDNLDYLRFTEEEGAPPDSLFRLSSLLERHLESRVEVVKTWLNPLIILVLGALVGLIMLAIYSPYLNVI